MWQHLYTLINACLYLCPLYEPLSLMQPVKFPPKILNCPAIPTNQLQYSHMQQFLNVYLFTTIHLAILKVFCNRKKLKSSLLFFILVCIRSSVTTQSLTAGSWRHVSPLPNLTYLLCLSITSSMCVEVWPKQSTATILHRTTGYMWSTPSTDR